MKDVNYDLVCLVSNDLVFDRRMIRACETLAQNDLKVLLVGRVLPDSPELYNYAFDQHRVTCQHHSGPLFYIELAFKLAKFLKTISYNQLLFVDLDTVLVSRLIIKEEQKYFLDLHEYFEEVPELKGAYLKKMIWRLIERICIPKCDVIYTVNQTLADIFEKRYGRTVGVIRNVPPLPTLNETQWSTILQTVYLGVLNPGRGLESLVTTIKERSNVILTIIGDGPLGPMLRDQATECNNIIFAGALPPSEISRRLENKHIGWNLLDGSSKSYYNSLANKFFDYIAHGIPIVTMDFPEYRSVINEYHCGLLIPDLSTSAISDSLDKIKDNEAVWQTMHENCKICGAENNWELESKKLIGMYL